jgi:hypothetical protein
MATNTSNVEKVNYGSLTIKQLRVELNRRHAKTSGRKHELVERFAVTSVCKLLAELIDMPPN